MTEQVVFPSGCAFRPSDIIPPPGLSVVDPGQAPPPASHARSPPQERPLSRHNQMAPMFIHLPCSGGGHLSAQMPKDLGSAATPELSKISREAALEPWALALGAPADGQQHGEWEPLQPADLPGAVFPSTLPVTRPSSCEAACNPDETTMVEEIGLEDVCSDDSGNLSPSNPVAPMQPVKSPMTTLVVQNLPGRYTRADVLQAWPVDGTYDYMHLPYNLLQKRPLGYVFINFVTHELAAAFQKAWHGKPLPNCAHNKPLHVAAAEVQGRRANLELIKSRKITQLEKAGFLPIILNGKTKLHPKEILEELAELHSGKKKPAKKPHEGTSTLDPLPYDAWSCKIQEQPEHKASVSPPSKDPAFHNRLHGINPFGLSLPGQLSKDDQAMMSLRPGFQPQHHVHF